MTSAATELQDHPALAHPWYYSIELAPGIWTRGAEHANVAATRALLARTQVEGVRCLDIGAQEGLVTALLCRRGASEVVAYDRADRSERLDLVREAMGLQAEYVQGTPLSGLRARLREMGRDPFDVVIFSGVLYHMFDPLGGLADVRALVRNGGLVIVETSAVVSAEPSMHFNTAGRFFGWSTYWQVSLECLDYMLRFLRLEPIDCVFVPSTAASPDAPPLVRVAVTCRAVDRFVPDPGDRWMASERAGEADYAEHLDWEEVTSTAPAVGYQAPQKGLVRRPGGSVDLFQTVRGSTPVDATPERVKLSLDMRE